MLLIGSQATHFWHSSYKVGKNADWDILCDINTAMALLETRDLDPLAPSWKMNDNIELHNSNFLNNADIERYATNQVIGIPDTYLHVRVCSSRGLAAIKRAHLYRSLNFAKHIIQYQFLDRDFNTKDIAFIQKRNDLTVDYFGDPAAGTKNVNNEDFFDDGVTRTIPHDQLHRMVAHYDEPLYLGLKIDKSMAAYSWVRWDNLSHEDKIKAIQEECYVLAIERFLLPIREQQGRKFPYHMAFHKALEKVCTTLDDGPFREYAIDHWNEVRQFNPNILDNFFKNESTARN